MASARTIGRLHEAEQKSEIPTFAQPVKINTLLNSEPDAAPPPREREHRTRGRFAIGIEEPKTQDCYSMTQPEVMTILGAESAPPGGDRFEALRLKEQFAKLVAARSFPAGQRGNAGRWPLAAM